MITRNNRISVFRKISACVLQIISKDDVAAYGTFEISGRLTTSIVVMLTRDMSPSARLVAYYILDTEIVADALNIRVEEIYENKVKLCWNIICFNSCLRPFNP